ncbi:LysR family transcriptional regulator [Vibrio sp. CAU 1672]|uniref:LysR family transcriptional regulator n=1 Tax=Vibrio sp. CAU 1672 TaxID=3032594 RepID=UPI0023DB89E3|nr:LysR family transcriptional regulator [Vibrio sp. CAU 1672]MDF2153538.1 LysR family transcriptional regulator [Vibrio sp. CAU 1672]
MTKDLNLLRLLVILNEERQTVQAAKRLHVSQPTISVMLKKLREQFNDPLFVRDKNKLEPTLRCQQLLEQLPALLDGLDTLYVDESKWDISQVTGELSLLFSPPLMSTLAVPLVNKIAEQAPNATVECYHWAFDAIRDMELKRKCWGFSYLPMPTNKNILQKDIGNDEFVMVMRNDHPLVEPTVEEALKYPLCTNLIYGENESSRREKIIKNIELQKYIQVRTSDISMLLGLLENSNFISITSRHNMMRFKGRYRFEPLPEVLTNDARYRQFSLFTHQRNRIDPLTTWLFDQAKAIMCE